MNVTAIIGELRLELERIDTLILALEALQLGRRRGRPPKALQALRSGAAPGSSPAAQKAAAAVREATAESAGRGKKGVGRPRGKKTSKAKP